MTAHAASSTPASGPLAFAHKGGPLLAVVALCGGAGASTVALLTALAAARGSTVPVMVCDTGGPGGGLACYLGMRTRLSLASASERLANREPFAREDLMADVARGRLRVMAAGPELDPVGDLPAAERILGDARLAHGLTVVDCATMSRPLERAALRIASHVAWLLPATISGAKRAAEVLRRAPIDLPGRELVIARHDPGERKPPMRELKTLADQRGGPLVLLPHVPDLAETDRKDALDDVALTLQALGTLLRR